MEICFGKVRKHCGKRRKCCLLGISPFPTMFSKGVFLKVVISWDNVGKSYGSDTSTIHTVLSKPLAAFPHEHK